MAEGDRTVLHRGSISQREIHLSSALRDGHRDREMVAFLESVLSAARALVYDSVALLNSAPVHRTLLQHLNSFGY